MKSPEHNPNLPLVTAQSSDFRNVKAAVEHAGQPARDIAKQTNAYLVVQYDGQLLKLKVN